MNVEDTLAKLKVGDYKTLARALTIVENDLEGYQHFLKNLEFNSTKVIGITGPPGAGKSSIINSLIEHLSINYRIAILAIDPTSPFNMGSLLGDRIRMNAFGTNANVYIRSAATRGSLGGLTAKTIEMVDVLKSSHFDFIFVETVGVGQSEIEIVGLADFTIVVLVPEAGDDIQTIKSGIMEIADLFIVNKSDREGADKYFNDLKAFTNDKSIPIIKTSIMNGSGLDELSTLIQKIDNTQNEKRLFLLTEKAFKLIEREKMKNIDKIKLKSQISNLLKKDFNLYRFVENFIHS